MTRTGTGPRERTVWRARRQEGTSWPGSPGSMSCKPPPKAKPFFFVFLAATGSCFAPCPAPAQCGQTSHSMQPPGGAPPHRPRSKRRARHSGAGPDPRLRFLPRAASCHSPVTLCRSPTLRDSARHPAGPHSRAPPHRLPAPSSSLRRLPPAASVPVSVTGLVGMSLSWSSLPWHGDHTSAPHRGDEHRPGHAGTPPGFPHDAGSVPRSTVSGGRQAWSTAPLPLSPVNSRYYSNNFPCMIDFFCQVFYSPAPV